jgi:hypothetical protein
MKFIGLFIVAIIGAPLALPGAANATTASHIALQLAGAGHHVHTMATGESDVNLCADNVGKRVAHCLARIRTKVGIAPMLGNGGAYDPAYLQSAYNAPSSDHGTGKTVAIVDAFDDPTAEADLAAYRSHFGLSACTTANGCFKKIDEFGGTTYPDPDPDWAVEIALDIDMVSAICPNCHILLVEANDATFEDLLAAEQAAKDNGADVISNSWGGPDMGYGPYFDSSFDLGIPVVAASGDDGYGVEYPASSKNVVAAGGTHLLQATNTRTRDATETAWDGAGSGCSDSETKPAWQSDPFCDTRMVADVSAVADPTTPVWAYQGGTWYTVGGTSAASPIVASFYALATKSDEPGAELLYEHSDSLNDITTGTNGSCGNLYFCKAGVGYDGPTGLGTPNGIDAFGGEPAAPANITPPSIGGTVAVTDGSATAEHGVWSGEAPMTYTYQWQLCDENGDNCNDIADATDSTYAPVEGDIGSTLRVEVSATNDLGSAGPVASDASSVIVDVMAPSNLTPPSILPSTTTNNELDLHSEGTWIGSSDTSHIHQWQRCDLNGDNCNDIADATDDTYHFTVDDVNSTIRIEISKTNSAGTGVAYSDTFEVDGLAPENTAMPTVSGSAVEGRTLTGTMGTWTGSETIGYVHAWFQCTSTVDTCVPVDNGERMTYVVTAADVGKKLAFGVLAFNDYGYDIQFALSAKVVKGAPLNVTKPKLSGTAKRGYTLKTSNGMWRGTAKIAVSGYRWYRCNSSGTECKPISGATKSSYIPTSADHGHKLRSRVAEKNGIGSAAALSAASSAVA